MRVLIFSFLIALFTVPLIKSQPAQAGVFQWRDQLTKVTLTYPDRWRQVHNQQSNDVFTVMAPGQEDHASCRMRIDDDRRYVIFPRRYDPNIQRIDFSRAFWEEYVGSFGEAHIHSVTDNAGLGLGFASYADVSFVTANGPKVQKRGIMFATLYNDNVFILECSADVHAYEKWYRPFLSVLHSVQLRKEYHGRRAGHYRNFLGDGELRLEGEHPKDLYVY